MRWFTRSILKNGSLTLHHNGYGYIKGGNYNFFFILITPSFKVTSKLFNFFKVCILLIIWFSDFNIAYPFFKFFSIEEVLSILLSKLNAENLKIVNNSFYDKSNFFNDILIRLQDNSPKQKILEIQSKIGYINNNNKTLILNKFKIFSQKLYLLNKILNTSSIEKNLKKGYAILKS